MTTPAPGGLTSSASSGRRGRRCKRLAAAALLAGLAGLALTAPWALATNQALAGAPRSGLADMTPALQAMQRDDTLNPGMLWVHEGAAHWQARPPGAAKACVDCHGAAEQSLRGVAARYPAFDAPGAKALSLGQRIAECRTKHQGAAASNPEEPVRLALEAFVAYQSRGLPLATPQDPRLTSALKNGQALFERRLGQLDLSCAHCHDERAGLRLGGSAIPQGHANAYPLYRLQWQTLGSLQRRLRNCITGVRAQPWASDAPQWVELELYLAQRAAGLVLEAPGVRP